ncbi:DNA adenine methylase [Actinokineospora diospyrosa]|uniref:site-specific DNA-methyltransferase (adenine-specific) n=1 Tax=Actinokineospora diospyrosa TaxID=103728 RepID=A0ABT1IKP9_9PSEU|nr:DNA adenine methylase [Actinokineospora diospyrosa]MCP2273222.1 adenine-specific DNA-methyltransferase [Actinokineospora diospyrosa]
MAEENPDYLRSQLITYLGNKRGLLAPIDRAVRVVRDLLGRRLRILDAFAGSGVVSRALKQHATCLVVNDIEDYARVASQCYLTNAHEVDLPALAEAVADLNRQADLAPTEGFIRKLYAPANDDHIQPGERVFYTTNNASRLDTYASLIREAPVGLRPLLLGPLLSAASIHTNTAGLFKGFYKDRTTGVGHFGGSGKDALSRIKGEIRLNVPILSDFTCAVTVLQQDANTLPDVLDDLDLAYLDPPYNQHPYGSNYFMLNLLVNYTEPDEISPISGIPTNWRRSAYNIRKRAPALLADLIERIPARFILVSANNEGFISPPAMHCLLRAAGTVTEFTTQYNTFRGSRNLRSRTLHVTEHLYLVDKSHQLTLPPP